MTEAHRKLKRVTKARNDCFELMLCFGISTGFLYLFKAPPLIVTLTALGTLALFGAWFALLFYAYELLTDIVEKESE